MAIRSTISSSLLFLGVLTLVIDLGATAITTTVGLRQRTNDAFIITAPRKFIHYANAIGKSNVAIDDDKCKANIKVNQSPMGTLPNGIPLYGVEVANTCVSGCNISNIHLSCGWFSSATVINPKIFKRLSYNDCLVNDGKSLGNGLIVSFRYANTFPYPLSLSSLICA